MTRLELLHQLSIKSSSEKVKLRQVPVTLSHIQKIAAYHVFSVGSNQAVAKTFLIFQQTNLSNQFLNFTIVFVMNLARIDKFLSLQLGSLSLLSSLQFQKHEFSRG